MMAWRRVCIPLLLAAVVWPASPALAALPMKVVSVTSPVKPGAPARVEVQTAPSAVCSIDVFYKSGKATAAPLRPRRADERGRVVWLWRVGTKTAPGAARVFVDCLLGEELGALETRFMVK